MFLAKHRMKHKIVLVCGVELYGYSERNFSIRSESSVVICAWVFTLVEERFIVGFFWNFFENFEVGGNYRGAGITDSNFWFGKINLWEEKLLPEVWVSALEQL